LEAGAPQLDFLGRRVPDDACHHHVRHDRRLVLGSASPVNAATNANHPVAGRRFFSKFTKKIPDGWYVLREWGSARDFDFVGRLIKKFGYKDTWGNRSDSYLVIGRFKYWRIEDVLNRAAPLSNAAVRKRGLRWLARHGKKIGPWGRLISVKKKRGS
jgi:hypothetical protein